MSSPPSSPPQGPSRRRRESGAFDPPRPRRELSPQDAEATRSPAPFAPVVPDVEDPSTSRREGIATNDNDVDTQAPPTTTETEVPPPPISVHSDTNDNTDETSSESNADNIDLNTMKPLVQILAAAMKQLSPSRTTEDPSAAVLTQHRITSSLNKELLCSSYGKNKYEGLNNIVKFSNFYDFVSRKHVKYTPLIETHKFTSKDFFNEIVAETMTGRVQDALNAAAVSQPSKYELIVANAQSFLTQVAKLAILPNEANSVFDKASELPSRTGILKLFNQLKKLQTVSKVMLQVHGSPVLEDNILLFLLRQKMHPEIKAKVEADMADKNYSFSTEGIESFYVHKATQYETARSGSKKDQLNSLVEPEEPQEEGTTLEGNKAPPVHEVNFMKLQEPEALETTLCHLQEHLAESEYYEQLAEPIEDVLNAISSNRKGKRPMRKPQDRTQRFQAMQGNTAGPSRLPPSQGTSTAVCPFNWKPPSMPERRERYAQGQCTTCGAKDHFRANCPCAGRMQKYVASLPPVQQRLHCMLDALAPDVTEMDTEEQDFHVETLKYLEKAEQSFR